MPADRGLQCLQVHPKAMNKHAEVPKGRSGGGEKWKPPTQVVRAPEKDQLGAP